MAGILNRDEIEAILGAIESGRTEGSGNAAGPALVDMILPDDEGLKDLTALSGRGGPLLRGHIGRIEDRACVKLNRPRILKNDNAGLVLKPYR